MKADIGMSGYPVKVAGVIIGVISIVGYTLGKLTGYDPPILENLHLAKLFFLLFACGMVLFLFSKDRKNVDTYIYNTNMISRYFLTALYSGLIAFSLVQSMNNNYDIDLLVPILFFLILQIIYTLVIQYHNLSNKGFYLFSTIMFVAGLIVLLLL